MWREVPDVEKSVFQQEYEMEKVFEQSFDLFGLTERSQVEYEKSMKVYHNSAQYQAYMNHKNASSLKTPGKASRSRMDMGENDRIMVHISFVILRRGGHTASR